MSRNPELNPFKRLKMDLQSLAEGKGLRSKKETTVELEKTEVNQPTELTGRQKVSAQVEAEFSRNVSAQSFRISLALQLSTALGLPSSDPAIREVVNDIKKDPSKNLPSTYQYVEGSDVLSDPATKIRATEKDLLKEEEP